MPHTDLIIDGEKWPSVTEILNLLAKPSLSKWREWKGTKEADRISKEAAERGKKLHEMVELFLKGETVVLCGEDEELRPIFKAWFEWWRDSKYTCVAQELKVISKKYNYGGTYDSLLKDNKDRLVIVDWKFSNNDDRLRWLQLAGYAQAILEHSGERVKRGMIVRIDKKGKVHVKECKNLGLYVPLFLGLRKLWDFCNKKGKYNI